MENDFPKIKILVSYHDEHQILKSDILVPIQTGRALTQKRFVGMIGDDTGDNISVKNPYYAEISAQYWAWKNYEKLGNPDYIGFMHYRRHFILDETKYKKQYRSKEENAYNWIIFESMHNSYLQDIEMTDDDILREVSQYDCICAQDTDFSKIGIANTVEDYMKRVPGSTKNDLDIFFNLIEKEYPMYTAYVAELKQSPHKILCNMFIMRKDLFEQYNLFLFDVLSKLEKRINPERYIKNGFRLFGYMGEFCLSLFINRLKENREIKLHQVPLSYIRNTSCQEITPLFDSSSVAVAMSASNEYVPALAVSLLSLAEHADAKCNYDLIVFERAITTENKSILKQLIERANISLRFINPTPILQNYTLPVSGHFALECFFRIASPLVLSQYKRLVFTDCDLIFKSDVQSLYQMPLNGKLLAAARESFWPALLRMKECGFMDYAVNTLHLKDPYQYYNTGVLVLDLERFRETDACQKLLKMADGKSLRLLEQDILNMYFDGEFCPLPAEWNCVDESSFSVFESYFTPEEKQNMTNIRAHAKILHYAGSVKPWQDLAETAEWWTYVKRTPFYQMAQKQRDAHNDPDFPPNKLDIEAYCQNYFCYTLAKLLRHLTFGKTKIQLTEYRNNLKQHIENARRFRTGLIHKK